MFAIQNWEMSPKESIIPNFSRILFWDASFETIDWQFKASYVIERVVNYGSSHDWKIAKQYYGFEQIRLISLQLRDLAPESLSFLSCIFDIPKEQFRCYTLKQSSQQPDIAAMK
jgi:hypothetical protein